MKRILSSLLLTGLLSSCAPVRPPAPQPPAPPPPPPFLEHTVRKGETLGRISQWYTGSAQNWQAIVKANPRMKPKSLRAGDVVRIPRELVKTEAPLPPPKKQSVTKPRRQRPTESATDISAVPDIPEVAVPEPTDPPVATPGQPTEAAAPAVPNEWSVPAQEPPSVDPRPEDVETAPTPVPEAKPQPTAAVPVANGNQASVPQPAVADAPPASAEVEPAAPKSVQAMVDEEKAALEKLKQELQGNPAEGQ